MEDVLNDAALATVQPGSNSPTDPSRPVLRRSKGLRVHRPARQVYDWFGYLFRERDSVLLVLR
jgi:hypothetical protein